jgi:hypothetical protein
MQLSKFHIFLGSDEAESEAEKQWEPRPRHATRLDALTPPAPAHVTGVDATDISDRAPFSQAILKLGL